MRVGFAACILALVGLWACVADTSYDTASTFDYCLGQVQDDVSVYLAENSEPVARAVARDEMFVLRDYSNEEFRVALRRGAACQPGEERISGDELQRLINESIPHGAGPSGEPCRVDIPHLHERTIDDLFQQLGASGVRWPVVSGGDGSASVLAWDECPAVEAITDALLSAGGHNR